MKTATLQDLERRKQDLYNQEVMSATMVQQEKVDHILSSLVENIEVKPLHKNPRRRWTNSEMKVFN
jgi:hypothetical protein